MQKKTTPSGAPASTAPSMTQSDRSGLTSRICGGVTLPLSLDQSLAGESFDRPARVRGLGLTV